MPDGGEVRMHARPAGDTVCITVADTGAGMTEDVRRKMFEPFFTTKKHKGMGVGMSVTEHIVHQHGGRIEVDSAPDEGTRISIHLPAAAPEGGERGSLPPGGGPAWNVLVVDDDAEVRRFAAEALRASGFRVHAAASGARALALLARLDRPPDLVLTDLRMPAVGGLEVARTVKRRRPDVPVVVMTAWPK